MISELHEKRSPKDNSKNSTNDIPKTYNDGDTHSKINKDAINRNESTIQPLKNNLRQQLQYSDVTRSTPSMKQPLSMATETDISQRFSQNQIEDADGRFTLVQNRRKRKAIFGAKESENSIAGQRIVHEISVFIGSVSNDITKDKLKEYIINEIEVSPQAIELNKENKFNRSFKIKIKSEDKSKIFEPTSWDKNIIVKPFREKAFTPFNMRNGFNGFNESNYRNPRSGFNNHRNSQSNDQNPAFNENTGIFHPNRADQWL